MAAKKKITKKASKKATKKSPRKAVTKKKVTKKVTKKATRKPVTKKATRKPVTKKVTKRSLPVKKSKRGTIYQPILDKMAKMTSKSDAITVSPPKGVHVQVFQNRLNAAFARFPVTAPKGYRFTRQATPNGKIDIFLIRAK